MAEPSFSQEQTKVGEEDRDKTANPYWNGALVFEAEIRAGAIKRHAILDITKEADVLNVMCNTLLPDDSSPQEPDEGAFCPNRFKILILNFAQVQGVRYLHTLSREVADGLEKRCKLPMEGDVLGLALKVSRFRHWAPSTCDSNIEAAVIHQTQIARFPSTASIAYHRPLQSTLTVVYGASPEMARLFVNFALQHLNSPHWAWVLLLQQKLLARDVRSAIRTTEVGLSRVENHLKMQSIWTEEEVLATKAPPQSADLSTANKELNGYLIDLAFQDFHCENALSVLDQFMITYGDQQLANHENVEADLVARFQDMRAAFEGLRWEGRLVTRRCEIQLQTLFSMTSQRDSAVQLEIARLSRNDNAATREIAIAAAKDSATMRVIAYVTLAFLPATFVATFFSTSFFDFRPLESNSRVSAWLWLYFVLSVPLTIAVILMWRTMSRQKERELLSRIPAASSEGKLEAHDSENQLHGSMLSMSNEAPKNIPLSSLEGVIPTHAASTSVNRASAMHAGQVPVENAQAGAPVPSSGNAHLTRTFRRGLR